MNWALHRKKGWIRSTREGKTLLSNKGALDARGKKLVGSLGGSDQSVGSPSQANDSVHAGRGALQAMPGHLSGGMVGIM
jgi:hypothetical protein